MGEVPPMRVERPVDSGMGMRPAPLSFGAAQEGGSMYVADRHNIAVEQDDEGKLLIRTVPMTVTQGHGNAVEVVAHSWEEAAELGWVSRA